MDIVNLTQTFSRFDEAWSPKLVGQVNACAIKLVKCRGAFVWHQHDVEDELFLVVKGTLLIKLRTGDLWLKEGELVVIPHGVEHLPIADEEVHVLLLEPTSTLNTGNVRNERTLTALERL